MNLGSIKIRNRIDRQPGSGLKEELIQKAQKGQKDWKSQRGTILVLTAVMITIMLGMLALSIDLGYAFSARNQLQNGVDAAALAGASALRSSIETDQSMSKQADLVRDLAVLYGSYNQVRRYSDPEPGPGAANQNQLVIEPGQVTVDTATDLPQVRIDTRVELSLLFAGLFGLPKTSIQSIAKSSLLPVDGGTGSSGSCWRPIFVPDTFFDSTDTVRYVGDPLRGASPLPERPGDYYRTRFAAGIRNLPPYLDTLTTAGAWVTGLRDTSVQSDIGTRTIMGKYVQLRREYYRIADLTMLPRVTSSTLGIGDLANYGYCGQVRVGDLLPIFNSGNATAFEQVRIGLASMKSRTNDMVDVNALTQYRYVRSVVYPAPNSHATIIPIMLFNPFELIRNPGATELRVTNIGFFYLQDVTSDGTLVGFFVREIVAGGTPISATSFDSDQQTMFRRTWLPMATQLLQ